MWWTNGTPDLRNRFIIGVSDEINFRNIGGNSTIQLQKTNLPHLEKQTFHVIPIMVVGIIQIMDLFIILLGILLVLKMEKMMIGALIT